MTDKGRFARFRFAVIGSLLALGAACAGGTPRDGAVAEGREAGRSAAAEPPFEVEVAPPEVIDAGVLVVVAKPRRPMQITDFTGRFKDIVFPVFEAGDGTWQGVLGVPLDTQPGPSAVRLNWIENGQGRTQDVSFKVVSGNYPEETLKVEPKKVDPPISALPRIRREQRELGAVYRRMTPKKLWKGPFVLPVQSEPTSIFGTRRVYNGTKRSPHMGLDLRAKTGTPIVAAANGIVAYSKYTYFAGGTIILDHGYGIFTVYAHMSRMKVKPGQEVKAGQVVGLSGATGRVTGPHLHWGAQLNGVKINPVHLTQVMR